MPPSDAELPLYSAAQSRELDRRAIEQHGIPGYRLMNHAGGAAFAALRRHWPDARRIGVLCGAGNNAGDGYVLARLAAEAGYQVALCSLVDPGRLAGDARRAWQAARDAGLEVQPWRGRLPAGEVQVDALLGTGLQRELAGEWRAAVEALNAAATPVLAIDIPSGLQADTGRVLGCAVRAELTVTFIARKLGLYTGEGPEHAGRVLFDGLAVPSEVYREIVPLASLIGKRWVRDRLPPRPRTAHKGQCGRVLVVGGQPGMGGAALLAGSAAARGGAGLVSVATAPAHAAALLAARPELMVHGVEGTMALRPLCQAADWLALGPGLGQGAWGRTLWAAALGSGRPLVVDADALNLLAAEPLRRDDWILTPHPGEAGRLLGCGAAAVQADRLAAVRELQARYGGVVLLKGAGTLIAAAEGVWLSTSGNPGMASGGMGDALTGLIAALAAQGQAPAVAATAGAWLHGAAGDRAARGGERGLLAGDLIEALRGVLNEPA
ncbi:NAD(P)H-hydrate dehydratase [Thiohalobacter sp. IOR34]|uniref:NAD(P)H-hydrate dehydratase n=1 Tax=Thiohalobacter sp. IOR34 TaxID=3057176 RepID=UPI0025B15A3A|nr:NAD(P)H-hydrate dehydratase [Thiohalobacter sp. IOR34]WJW74826.1 NAD(P)H-hydrate dehydratase [Thiohalobacter sp. IOR34]